MPLNKVLNFGVFILICSILFCCSSARVRKEKLDYIPYYLSVYKADSLYQTNNYEAAYNLLDSLFKKYPVANVGNYNEYGIYVNCAVLSNNLNNIREKVEYGYRNFGSVVTLHKEGIERSLELNRVASLSKDEIKQLTDAYYNSINKDLRAELMEMFEQDQQVRLNNDRAKWKTVDSLNHLKLKRMFEKYGFISTKMYGAASATFIPDHDIVNLTSLLLHLPEQTKKDLLPLLLSKVKTGECDPEMYALLYDRVLLDANNEQLYDSFNCNSCNLIDPDQTDSLRASIGLPNRDYSTWRMKVVR